MPSDVIDRVRSFNPAQVGEWLVGDAAQIGDFGTLIEGFAMALRRAGLPLDRLTIGIPILLPHISGAQFRWYPDRPIERLEFRATAATLGQLEASPIRVVYQEGRATRVRIGPRREPGEYPIVDDLRGEGFTDYAVLPVPFSDGSFKALTVATRAQGGFPDDQVEALAGLTPQLAPVLEVRALRHLARSLLDVYVGPTAGGRVLGGEVRRGDGAMIDAVIWFCDLRGSTDLAMSLEGPALIGLLNGFFGAITGAVAEHGGEVLKFIGDSVLAIFPCADIHERGCTAACDAEAAAADALSRIERLNRVAGENGGREISVGIALHIGPVFFGNVGGEDRLDFTVIGPAVNLASRIQSLTAETGRKLLVSEAFAQVSRSTYEPLGAFRLKGIEGWSMVFARPEKDTPV